MEQTGGSLAESVAQFVEAVLSGGQPVPGQILDCPQQFGNPSSFSPDGKELSSDIEVQDVVSSVPCRHGLDLRLPRLCGGGRSRICAPDRGGTERDQQKRGAGTGK